MQGFGHNEDLFTTVGFLHVWCPGIKDVRSVWEQDAFVLCSGLLNDIEELRRNLRFGWNALVLGAAED